MQVDSYSSANDRMLSLLVPKGGSTDVVTAAEAAALGQLRYVKSFDLDPARPRIALDVREAIADIQAKGYHVTRAVFTTETKDVPR